MELDERIMNIEYIAGKLEKPNIGKVYSYWDGYYKVIEIVKESSRFGRVEMKLRLKRIGSEW